MGSSLPRDTPPCPTCHHPFPSPPSATPVRTVVAMMCRGPRRHVSMLVISFLCWCVCVCVRVYHYVPRAPQTVSISFLSLCLSLSLSVSLCLSLSLSHTHTHTTTYNDVGAASRSVQRERVKRDPILKKRGSKERKKRAKKERVKRDPI